MLISTLRADRRAVAPTGAAARAQWVDLCERAIRELWDHAVSELVTDAGSGVVGVALAAVGSLGRRDCGPESDIDLVLIHDGREHPEIRGGLSALAEALWYPLWDSHVDLDHSVRSLDECRDVASHDLAASVALLDLRCIAGDAALVEEAAAAIHSDWRRGARLRFDEVDAERAARITRAGELAYEIEGDIKQAAGGFRDVVMIRAFVASWLAERPAVDYAQAYEFLLNVRDALATITRRHGHVLAIRLHDEVARMLGFSGDTAGDDLLSRISEAARVIQGAYLDTSMRARRNARPARPRLRFVRGKKRPVFDVVAPGVIHTAGELSLDSGTTLGRAVLLELALASIRHGVPIRQATLMKLGAADPATGETPWGSEPWDEATRTAIEEILASGPAQIPVWEQLDLAGCVTQMIPGWEAVRNVPQRSVIHRHTVDRHMLEAVSLLPSVEAAGGERLDTLNPHYRAVLLIATLLHDIGKAPGHPGHAERGAAMVPSILEQMGYSGEFVDEVCLLVRGHLLLGDLATSAAPNDPETIARIHEALGVSSNSSGKNDLLACLHLLTQVDAMSCKPEAWDSWKAGLVNDLVWNARWV